MVDVPLAKAGGTLRCRGVSNSLLKNSTKCSSIAATRELNPNASYRESLEEGIGESHDRYHEIEATLLVATGNRDGNESTYSFWRII